MKKLLCSLLLLLVSTNVMASNPYAPTLNNVTVLFDSFEKVFSPFLFDWVMGEALELKMDSSCQTIRVIQDVVQCVVGTQAVSVGILGPSIGNSEMWSVHQVKWGTNVTIIEINNSGRLNYSLKLK